MLMTRTTGHTMNRKERKARGIKGKKGDKAVTNEALKLARALKEKKMDAEALELYKRVLSFDPENEIALLDVGLSHYYNKNMPAAEKLFEQILRQNHKNIGANVMLASLRMDQNRVAEALDLVAKAERLGVPSRLFTRIGVLYRDTGQLKKATDYLETALKNDPEEITALYTLQTLRKFTPEEHARMENISKKPDLDLENKMRLNFTLGKSALDQNQTEKAFWYFAEANLLKRSTFKFDIAWIEDYFATIAKSFDRAFLEKFRGTVKNKGENQIFIIGMPRSGSTLVDQIISSHPLVTSVGEASFYTKGIPIHLPKKMLEYSKLPGAALTKELIRRCSAEMLERIGDNYLAQIAPFAKEQKIVVDKMLFNFIWLGMIRLTLPDAKIIHCVRDPIDIGLSIWQLMFSDDIPWAYDQRDIARYYLAYNKLMDHWRDLFPGEFFENHYEDMVADQESQSRRVIEFCGLPWHDDCLKFYENKRRVKTASVTQVRQPMYSGSVKKWKKYEKHLADMVSTVERGYIPPVLSPDDDEMPAN